MKRIGAFSVAALLILSLTGCGSPPEKTAPFEAVQTYTDIPGVTASEIAAIEAVKANRSHLSYGSLYSTESFALSDGTYAGFTIAFCKRMTEMFGIPFVREEYEWDELIDSLDARKVDFTGELTPTTERMKVYGMTHPIAERMLRVFMLAGSDKVQTEADITGLTIGFLEGSITADAISKTYPISFERVDVGNYATAVEMLYSGEIDAFVEEAVADPALTVYGGLQSVILFPMVHSPVSMATAEPELQPFISVVNKYIEAGGVDALYELYKEGDFQYAKHKLDSSFTEEERAYIHELTKKGAAVSVGFEHENYPVIFYNEADGAYEGIAVDILVEISKLTGIRFESGAPVGAIWTDLLGMLQSGEVLMTAQLLFTQDRDDQFLWSSVPYARSYFAIVSKADCPSLASYQVARERVGTMRNSGHAETYRELFPENDNLVEYDRLADCLDALDKGDVELLMGSEHTLLTQINYREKPGFKINIKLSAPLNSYFGFHKDQKVLRSIIDKAQPYVSTETIGINWTGRTFDYSKKLAEERALYMTIFVGVLLVILIATVFLLVKNVRLGKKLEDLANHDALTGIYNRRFFMELAEIQIARSYRTGIDCFVTIFDLDYFKSVNDTYGHLAGDKVLKEIAQRIKSVIRPYDILGRYGGEEFVLLMSDVKSNNTQYTLNTINRIRLEICKTPVDFEGIQIPISASFGVAYAAPKYDLATGVKHADEALYQAKEQGRNRVVFFGYDGESASLREDA